MASILVVAGTNEGEYHPLERRSVVVGRDDGCVIQVVDDMVSRQHFEIRFEDDDGTYHVRDLGSANGTFLNDRQIDSEKPLTDGDVIGVGHSELMYSALDFTDRDTAFSHYRERGHRGRSTVIGDK